MRVTRIALILGTLATTACGGTGAPGSTSGAAQTAARDYQTTGQSLSAAVAQYQAASAAMPDVAACTTTLAAYEAQVSPLIDRMRTASGAMDQYMDDYMGRSAADMACVAAAIALEYQRHLGVACAAPTLTGDRTEAAQHVATMSSWIDHQKVRYEQMGAAIGMMPATTDTTWFCQQNPDGSFTMGGHTWTPPQAPPAPGIDPVPTSSTVPPTPTPTPTPTLWPMPCGGYGCGCW